jgi:hypothetical protein
VPSDRAQFGLSHKEIFLGTGEPTESNQTLGLGAEVRGSDKKNHLQAKTKKHQRWPKKKCWGVKADVMEHKPFKNFFPMQYFLKPEHQ